MSHKYRLLLVFSLVLSTYSFGAGFSKRWFWFYHDEVDDKSYLVIDFDPFNADHNKVLEVNAITARDHTENPFSALFNGNWYNIFAFSSDVLSAETKTFPSFNVPLYDPLFKHIVTEATVFKFGYIGQNSKLPNYKKVTFIAKSSATITIFLEKMSDSEYRVSAVFMKSEEGEKYSYRDFSFRRDYGDGSGGGAGTLVNTLTHSHKHSFHQGLEKRSLDNSLAITSKYLPSKFEPLFKPVLYTYILKSF